MSDEKAPYAPARAPAFTPDTPAPTPALPHTELIGQVLCAVHFGTAPPPLAAVADALCDLRDRLAAAEAARAAGKALAEGYRQELLALAGPATCRCGANPCQCDG